MNRKQTAIIATAVVIGIFAFKAMRADEVETCNDASVMNTLIKGTVDQPRERLIEVLKTQGHSPSNDQFLSRLATLSATLSDITQIQYDEKNNNRTCQAKINYSVGAAEQQNSIFGLMASKSLCQGTILYRISRPLDNGNRYNVEWQCE